MATSRKIPSRWTLEGIRQHSDLKTANDNQLIWPRQKPLAFSPLLYGLYPNRDHNADLLAAIESLSDNSSPGQPIFSVFAADPFIQGKRIAPVLLARGYNKIVNWPTTAQYGIDFTATLDSVNLGPRQELHALRYLADKGLSISVSIVLPESLDIFMELEPEFIFLTPGFDLWKKGKLNTVELLKRCRLLSQITEKNIPIILMTEKNSISLKQAKQAGANAVLSA